MGVQTPKQKLETTTALKIYVTFYNNYTVGLKYNLWGNYSYLNKYVYKTLMCKTQNNISTKNNVFLFLT